MGDRKGIQPVKNPAPAFHRGCSLEDPASPGVISGNLRQLNASQ